MPEIINTGKPLGEAKKVAIMIHGRGATAQSILSLKDHLNLEDFALLAPQAPGNTWYPYSFMAPDQNNEPAYSNSIRLLEELVSDLYSKGFQPEQLFLIGFSQGACLALEFAAVHGKKYGGVIAFTGGLIGEQLKPEKYQGDLTGTKVFIGSSRHDMHVPLERIEASALLLEKMGASVKTLIFPDRMHTIRQGEIDWVNENMLS